VPEVLDVATHGSGAVLAATKLHIPRLRPELVVREALVEELGAPRAHKLTLIEAPAGYGKTTLLAEWAAAPAEKRGFAWLSLEETDSDPVRFWTGVIDALRTLEPGVASAARDALASRNIDLLKVALPLLVNALGELEKPLVLVLDDYQDVRDTTVHRSLDFVLDHLPDVVHVAVATRADPDLSLARRRASGELMEIRAAHLRFGEAEAAELLERTLSDRLSDRTVELLVSRTEGWPAGVYLAALSFARRSRPEELIESFAGDDRHIVDYLSSEVLSDQPPEIREFLLRTSVLEQLCGPLCNAVSEVEDSARLLERIERQNLFLIPLDTTRTWYRYHRLFADLLRHELALSDPAAASDLHRRAADWYERDGSVPSAIHHATAAGDVDRARELIAGHWNDYFNRGELGTVQRWLESAPGPSTVDPRLCVAGAWVALDRGALREAGEWIERGTAGSDASAEGAEADLEVLRAVHGFKVGDIGAASASALRIPELAAEGSFPRTVAELILGIARYWTGSLDDARTTLRRAAALANAAQNDLGQSYALGYLALATLDQGSARRADELATEAIELRRTPGFAEHFVLMIGHLARGRVALAEGRLEDAQGSLARALELSERGAGRIEQGAALLALAQLDQLRGERDRARARLRQARDAIEGCAEAGTLGTAIAAAERTLGVVGSTAGSSPAGADELTERELAILRMLVSDLSRRQIADALFISTNTVKTHLRAIYRKLDASGRDSAIARGRELGLL
jgi:LuxR family maltose regulon positive regulatory protein